MVICKWSGGRCICSIILLVTFGFTGGSSAKAADMTVSSLSPANNTVEVCADTKLWITFATTPIVATDSNMYLQICKVSDNSVVYQLTLYTLPSDSYGHVAAGWPSSYKITLNGKTLNYEPFAVSGNTVEIYPSTRLEYNTAYYVKMTAGFCTDADGNTSPDINDNVTWQFTTKAAAPAADHDYIVALDGSGDFCTLQGATDAAANSDPCRTLIRVKKGIYREMVHMPSNKINVTWLGEDRDTTIMAVYNCENFNSGSDNRMMIRCYANGFRMYNMTYHNLKPKGGSNAQAETIKHSGQQSIVKNCKYMSYQDTLCLNGQMYLKDCYIEGDTDYIWGYGTVYFDKCEMRSLSTQSHVTQSRTANGTNGLFFVDCNLTCPTGLTNCDLGRMTLSSGVPSAPYAQAAFINCIMPSTLIIPAGWRPSTPDDLTNRRWWEYKSVEPNGTLIDVSQRLNPGSKQLDDANAVWWRDVNNVFGSWNPKVDSEPPSTSWQPQPTDGATDVTSSLLSWSAGAGATSHRIYFGTVDPPPFAAEQTDTSYLVMDVIYADTTYYWRVDEKNSAGITTGTVWSFTTTSEISDPTPPSPNPMTWAVEPNAVDANTITMAATTATDDSGVEYYFTNITDPNHDSGWQDSNTYTDTSLVNNTTYTYKVKACDMSLNHNRTADSNEASATTLRYNCASTLLSDFDGNCQVNFFDYSQP